MALKYVSAIGPLQHLNTQLVTAKELLREGTVRAPTRAAQDKTNVRSMRPTSAVLVNTKGSLISSQASLELPVMMAPPVMPQIGYLTHEHFDQVIPLHGAPNAQNRYGMEYYVVTNSAGRIKLCTAQDRDLWSGDTVEVPGLPGAWRVTLFEPRYNYPQIG
jgi:hypothetical protein